MATSPLLQEIHQARELLAQKHGNDLKAICRDAQQKQAHSGHRLVHLEPKLITSSSTTVLA